MGFFDTLAKVGGALVEQAQKDQARKMKEYSRKSASEGKPEPTIGGKTLREWEGSWQYLGTLDSANLSHLSSSVGLYRAKLQGEIVYIGRAVEYSNGGLRKRLSDYTRESDSSRKHASGQSMNKHASQLSIDVLITGSDPEAVDAAKKLEQYFIGAHSPAWNKMFK
jgi:hypothetical protein